MGPGCGDHLLTVVDPKTVKLPCTQVALHFQEPQLSYLSLLAIKRLYIQYLIKYVAAKIQNFVI